MPPPAPVATRWALPDDLSNLSALALRSKAHWGYDRAFLEACRAELTITPERLDREEIRIAESPAGMAGFVSVRVDGRTAELMDLFVDPDHIGTGVGSILWNEAVAIAVRGGARVLRVESDPHAEEWYRRRGAVRVGTAPSGSIPGRRLPLLELVL